MKVLTKKVQGTCESCTRTNVPLNIVTFERASETKLLCDFCFRWTLKVIELVDVKEAEA